MAAPFAAQFAGAGAGVADAAVDPAFTVLGGLSELRLTELALNRLASQAIEVQAVAPATTITGADGNSVVGVKLTPEYATATITRTGQPSRGIGRLRGGVVLVNSTARMEVTEIRGSVPDGLIFAFLKVDDQWVGELPLYSADPSTVRLDVLPGAPGQPTTLRSNGVPVKPTQDAVDAVMEAFGVALFTVNDPVFTASGVGTAWPLPAQLLPLGR